MKDSTTNSRHEQIITDNETKNPYGTCATWPAAILAGKPTAAGKERFSERRERERDRQTDRQRQRHTERQREKEREEAQADR